MSEEEKESSGGVWQTMKDAVKDGLGKGDDESDEDTEAEGSGEDGAEGSGEGEEKADEDKDEYEKAREKVEALEDDPPQDLSDWPDDQAMYETFGGSDMEAYDEGATANLGPPALRRYADGSVEIEGEEQPVPVDSESLREIAEETGGTFKEAASAAELTEVYEDLGSQIGYVTEPREVTPWFIGSGLALAFLGAILSLLWTNRLL